MLNEKDIKSLFPIPSLTKVEGKITYNDIHESHIKLKTNAGSFHSGLRGGGNGLLGLAMCQFMYLILNGLALNLPQHPGYLPVVPYGATGETTSELVQQQMVHKTQFDITKSCDEDMRQKILASSHNDYVEVVANANFGFSHTTTLGLLNNLYN